MTADVLSEVSNNLPTVFVIVETNAALSKASARLFTVLENFWGAASLVHKTWGRSASSTSAFWMRIEVLLHGASQLYRVDQGWSTSASFGLESCYSMPTTLSFKMPICFGLKEQARAKLRLQEPPTLDKFCRQRARYSWIVVHRTKALLQCYQVSSSKSLPKSGAYLLCVTYKNAEENVERLKCRGLCLLWGKKRGFYSGFFY